MIQIPEIEKLREFIANKDYSNAEPLAYALLDKYPQNSILWANLSVIQNAKGNIDDAILCLEKSITYDSSFYKGFINLAQLENSRGNTTKSIQTIYQALQTCSQKTELYLVLGNLYLEINKIPLAIDSYSQSIEQNNVYIEAYRNRAHAFELFGNADKAIEDYKIISSLKPDDFDSHFKLYSFSLRQKEYQLSADYLVRLTELCHESDEKVRRIGDHLFEIEDFQGALKYYSKLSDYYDGKNFLIACCHHKLGRNNDAETHYRMALSCDAESVRSLVNLGNLLSETERNSEAYELLVKAVKLQPEDTNANYSFGNHLYKTEKFLEAAQYYENCLDDYSFNKIAYLRLGNIKSRCNDHTEALSNYNQCLYHDPGYVEAIYNIGIIKLKQNDHLNAGKYFEKILTDQPDSLDVNQSLGYCYFCLGEYEKAIKAFEKEIELAPSNYYARTLLIHARQIVCSWEDDQFYKNWLIEDSLRMNIPLPPWQTLSFHDDPEIELKIAQNYSKINNYNLDNVNSPLAKISNTEKAIVGFYSCDFFGHATMHIIEALLIDLKESNLQIKIYDYGHYQDDLTYRLRQMGHEYYDISGLGDSEVQQLAHEHKLDIAIDLKGYTSGQRTEIFTQRLAPGHISFLGYPGTCGSNMYDYIIADRITIPRSDEHHYTEKVLRIDTCYQPHNPLRPIDTTNNDRLSNKLPCDVFIFCSFNSPYKVSAIEFNAWMTILKKTDSILWLLKSSDIAVSNLRLEAQLRGVDPDRLFFAEKVSLSRHLGRHQCADMQLDTFNVNAHTTASDSLFTGLPILTKLGNTFSSRVCASLLTAANLDEFISYSIDEYIEKAIYYTTNKQKLETTRRYLMSSSQIPLFDTRAYAQNFEKLMLDIAK